MITPSFSLTATERVLPKLALDFTTASLDPRVTFTRTTDATHPATYTNSSGYVTASTNNAPRFDYDPVALTCKGLLIEESRTNICTYSEDFRNTADAGATRPWAYVAATLTADAATSPANTATADKAIPNTSATYHAITYSSLLTVSTAYSITIYAKAAGYSYISISNAGAGAYGASFNLSTGAIGTVGASATASISNVGNSWYRCTVNFTAAYTQLYISIGTTNAVGGNSFAGDGTSGIYVWGAQVEAGAFATSYIPTTSAALTRNADVATMTGTNFSDWYNASEGTIFVQSSHFATSTTTNQTIFSIQNAGSQADGILGRYRINTGIFRVFGSNAGAANQFILDGSAVANNVVCKGALGNATNNVGLSFNSGAVSTDTSSSIGSVSMMILGSIDTGTLDYLNGHLQKFNFYSQRLTNAELQAISK